MFAAPDRAVLLRGANKRGAPMVRLEKDLDGMLVVIEEARVGRGQRAVKTMWKERSARVGPGNDDLNKPVDLTSETRAGPANTITPPAPLSKDAGVTMIIRAADETGVYFDDLSMLVSACKG